MHFLQAHTYCVLVSLSAKVALSAGSQQAAATSRQPPYNKIALSADTKPACLFVSFQLKLHRVQAHSRQPRPPTSRPTTRCIVCRHMARLSPSSFQLKLQCVQGHSRLPRRPTSRHTTRTMARASASRSTRPRQPSRAAAQRPPPEALPPQPLLPPPPHPAPLWTPPSKPPPSEMWSVTAVLGCEAAMYLCCCVSSRWVVNVRLARVGQSMCCPDKGMWPMQVGLRGWGLGYLT